MDDYGDADLAAVDAIAGRWRSRERTGLLEDASGWGDDRLRPLRWLVAEVEGYGIAAHVVDDMAAPYVQVDMADTYGYRVRLTRRDGAACYLWGDRDATHSQADPAGAARRMVTALRQQRERTS